MFTTVRHVLPVFIAMPVLLALAAPPAGAQSATEPTAAELAEQIRDLKREYEARIGALEAQLTTLESRAEVPARESAAPAPTTRPAPDNAFNPAIGVVLNGMIAEHSADDSRIPGFRIGHEGERAAQGLSLGNSEISMSSNIDDKFFGSLTLGLGVHADEPTELELEEAYIQTLPGAGLPEGSRIKAGRALWTFGYLNELHAHGDDFADRPLPYRVFLDNAYNDDGVEVSVVPPTELYSEFGVGLFRGDDTPFAGSKNGHEAWSAFARLGGDIGRDSAWRVGGYVLSGEARNRGGGHGHEDEEGDGHGHEEEHHEEEHHEEEHEEHEHAEFFSNGMFSGDTRLYALDFRSTWAPTGNATDRELILQGEYFWRKENGTYELAAEDEDEEAFTIDFTPRRELPAWVVALLAIAGALVVATPVLLWREWWWKLGRLPRSDELFAKMCRLGAALGLRKRPEQTPLEYAAMLSEAIPAQRRQIQRITRAYVMRRYASGRVPLSDLRDAEWSWGSLRWAMFKRFFRVRPA